MTGHVHPRYEKISDGHIRERGKVTNAIDNRNADCRQSTFG
jgi:hypothetical protein